MKVTRDGPAQARRAVTLHGMKGSGLGLVLESTRAPGSDSVERLGPCDGQGKIERNDRRTAAGAVVPSRRRARSRRSPAPPTRPSSPRPIFTAPRDRRRARRSRAVDRSACPHLHGPGTNEPLSPGVRRTPLPPDTTWSLPTILGCLQTPILLERPVKLVDGAAPATGSPEAALEPPQLTPPALGALAPRQRLQQPRSTAVRRGYNQYDRPWRGSQADRERRDRPPDVRPRRRDLGLLRGHPHRSPSNASPTRRADANRQLQHDGERPGRQRALATAGTSAAGHRTRPPPFPRSPSYIRGPIQRRRSGHRLRRRGRGRRAHGYSRLARRPATTGSRAADRAATPRAKSHSPTGPRKSRGKHAGAPAGQPTNRPVFDGRADGAYVRKLDDADVHDHAEHHAEPFRRSGTDRGPHDIVAHPSSGTGGPPRRRNRRAARRSRVRSSHGQLISDVTTLPAGASPLVRTVAGPAPRSAPPARQALRASPLPALVGRPRRRRCCSASAPAASCAAGGAGTRAVPAAQILLRSPTCL